MARRADRFEDLIAWQKARLLAAAVYAISRKTTISKDFALVDQLRRSARSVCANTAEGFDRTGDREFHHGLSIAAGSCAEVRSDLYLALDAEYISQDEFIALYEQASEVARLIPALRAAVARRLRS
jgi:four helix bundle protein